MDSVALVMARRKSARALAHEDAASSGPRERSRRDPGRLPLARRTSDTRHTRARGTNDSGAAPRRNRGRWRHDGAPPRRQASLQLGRWNKWTRLQPVQFEWEDEPQLRAV